jgi:hypothetical protein
MGEVGHCPSPGTGIVVSLFKRKREEIVPVRNVNFYERENF